MTTDRTTLGRFTTRLATQADTQAILAFDAVARQERERVNFIYRTVSSRNCHVVTCDQKVVGYGVLESSFFGHGFVSMLYVDDDHRRRGAGTALMGHLERMCKSSRLFTACGQSNKAMQAMLEAMGYRSSGVIENISDEPELIYCKILRD